MKKKNHRIIYTVLICLLWGHSLSEAATPNFQNQLFDFSSPNPLFETDNFDHYFYQDSYDSESWAESSKDSFDFSIYEDTAYVYMLAVGITAILYFSPKEVSQWDDDEKNLGLMELSGKYWDNVSNGPVIDSDNFIINYFGHPYFGSVYYVRARHKKKSPLQSLAFSFFMSTFIYEYGIEAFFEKPSIQDMIVTPVFGAILGEFSLGLEQIILKDNRKLLYSRTLGELCLFLIDPLQDIVDPMKVLIREDWKLRVRKEFVWSNQNLNDDYPFQTSSESVKESVYGLKFVFYQAVR